MKLKRLVFLGAGLLALVLCLCGTVSAAAADSRGSLTMQCIVRTEGTEMPLSGDTYAIVPIARIDNTAADSKDAWQYTMLDGYQSFDCQWSELTSMQLREKVLSISQTAQQSGLYLAVRTVDEDGRLVFGDLTPGLYLVLRTNTIHTGTVSDPLLISVPEIIDGELVYHITAAPKNAAPPDSSTPTPPSDPEKLPQTGQLIWPVFVLAAAGGLLIAAGIGRMAYEKKHGYGKE